jgi:hypothetical protein
MELNYLCPECRSILNIGEKIVVSVRLKNKQNGLILIEKAMGNFNIKKHDALHYKMGDLAEFFCPICHENLQTKIHPNLAKLILIDESENEFDILFSRISGEQATYKIKDKNIEAFGDDQDIYKDFVK